MFQEQLNLALYLISENLKKKRQDKPLIILPLHVKLNQMIRADESGHPNE